MTKPWKLLPLITAMALVGCGDDKSSSQDDQDPGTNPPDVDNGGEPTPTPEEPETPEPTPEPEPELVSISGKVADGYLRDALVCLDLNMNMTCDAEEPSIYSGSGGKWELEVEPDQVESGARVIAQAKANLTIDEDTGNAIPNDYTLMAEFPSTADMKKVFVSPLTTLVAYESAHGQLDTVADAEAAVKARLATMADLTTDYIAAKQSSKLGAEEKREYEYLHRIAQIAAAMKGHYEKQLRSAGYNSMKSAEAATTKVRSILDVITADARASLNTETGFNVNQIIADGRYADLIPPPPPGATDIDPAIELADLGTLQEGETPFYTSNGNPVSQLSLTETRARYNTADKTIHLSAFASVLMEAPEVSDPDAQPADLWYQKIPQVIQLDPNRGVATLGESTEDEPKGYVAWSPETSTFVESAGYPATLGLRSVTDNNGSVSGSVFGGAVSTTASYTKVVTGYLGFQELFDWQFGHSAPERYFLKTEPGITGWETPLYTYEETLDDTLVVAPLQVGNGSENAVALSGEAGLAASINAVIADPQHRIMGLKDAAGRDIHMRLSGTAENGTIILMLPDGTVLEDEGFYTLESAPIPHLRTALPSSYTMPEIQNGFELGYPVIAEMQGRVRLAWVLPKNLNTSSLFGGNGTNMEYPISYTVIRELSSAVPVSISQ